MRFDDFKHITIRFTKDVFKQLKLHCENNRISVRLYLFELVKNDLIKPNPVKKIGRQRLVETIRTSFVVTKEVHIKLVQYCNEHDLRIDAYIFDLVVRDLKK